MHIAMEPNVNPQDEPQSQQPLDPTAVADLAYQRWVEKGCPQGSAEDDWFEAERNLRSGRTTMRAGA